MAVITRSSDALAALDSGVSVKAGLEQGSRVILRSGIVSVLASDSATSKYRILRLRSTDALLSLKLWSGGSAGGNGIGTLSSVQLGLYKSSDGDRGLGDAVAADHFITAGTTDLTAQVEGLEVVYRIVAGGFNDFADRVGRELWDFDLPVPLLSDPHESWDIVLNAVGTPTSAGSIMLQAVIAAA